MHYLTKGIMSVVKVLESNHVGITVQDLDYSLRFFTEVLGYEIIGKRAQRKLENMEKATGIKGCHVEIAYVKGGGVAIELLQYNGPENRHLYKPRCVDVGHWHLSINVENIDTAVREALTFGCTKVGSQITVDTGPNKGNQIQYIALKDGIIIEITSIANRE